MPTARCGVAHVVGELHLLAVARAAAAASCDHLRVQRVRHLVAALDRAVARCAEPGSTCARIGLRSRSSRSAPPRLTWRSRSVRPTDLLQRAQAQRGQDLAHLLGDEAEQVDRPSPGVPVNLLAQVLAWVQTPTGQVLEWHWRTMMQPMATSASGADAELLGAQHGGDDHVAAGLDAAVGAQARRGGAGGSGVRTWLTSDRPISQGVPAYLIEVCGLGAGAADVAGDQDHVGLGLGDAGGDRADAGIARPASRRPCASGLICFRS